MEKAAADHGPCMSLRPAFVTGIGQHPGIAGRQPTACKLPFSGKKGDAPRVAPAGTGEMAVYQTADVQPAHAPTFAEWKSHVLDDYKAEQAPQLLQGRLNKLAERAHQLNDLKKAAAELNVPVKTSETWWTGRRMCPRSAK